MTNEKIEVFINTNKKYFPADKLLVIKEKLKKLDEDQYITMTCIDFKDPTIMLLVSIFLGEFGVDKFMMGKVGIGLLKLFFGWLTFGIWWLIDILRIQKQVKDANFMEFLNSCNF